MASLSSICSRDESFDFAFTFSWLSGALPDFKLDIVDFGINTLIDREHPRPLYAYPPFDLVGGEPIPGRGHDDLVACPGVDLMEPQLLGTGGHQQLPIRSIHTTSSNRPIRAEHAWSGEPDGIRAGQRLDAVADRHVAFRGAARLDALDQKDKQADE